MTPADAKAQRTPPGLSPQGAETRCQNPRPPFVPYTPSPPVGRSDTAVPAPSPPVPPGRQSGRFSRPHSRTNAHVTLLEGSIKVSDTHHTKELLIKPGQNATLQKGGTFSIHEVQAKEYSTWAEGQFYFDDTELIEIMRELGRWYNVNIIFTNKEAMHYRMHFQSDRGDSLPQVLNLLNSMQKVNAKFENDKVIVGL